MHADIVFQNSAEVLDHADALCRRVLGVPWYIAVRRMRRGEYHGSIIEAEIKMYLAMSRCP